MTKLLKEIKSDIGECIEEQTKVFETLYKQFPIEKEIQFSEFNLSDIIPKVSFLQMKYFEFYIQEKSKLEILQDSLEQKTGEKYDYFRFGIDKTLTPKEIEKYYLPRDEEVKTIKKLILFQSFRVEFFEMCVNTTKNLNWNIKNFLETLKKGY